MEEALLKRILPHSIEAEQSVIGSMIMDREAIVVASEIVLGDDFYNKQYGIVFDTMVELNDDSQGIGSEVELWGERISANAVAAVAGTISYELLCNVKRARFVYQD